MEVRFACLGYLGEPSSGYGPTGMTDPIVTCMVQMHLIGMFLLLFSSHFPLSSLIFLSGYSNVRAMYRFLLTIALAVDSLSPERLVCFAALI